MTENKLLLDTHALLWWATNDKALGRKVRGLIEADRTYPFGEARR